MSVESVIALGSNMGDSPSILAGAVELLAAHERITVLQRSDMAVTAPVGGPEGQPDFYNMVVRISTTLRPFALLRYCQEIEHRFHRERTVRWGPRTLDVDIVTYGELHMDEPELMLPHPRAARRAFVLAPWARMDPQAMLDGIYVWALAERAPDADGLRGYLGADGRPLADDAHPAPSAQPGTAAGDEPRTVPWADAAGEEGSR